MLVVHGVWRPGVGLAVWAEDSRLPAHPPRRPGRAPRERPHPFAADHAALAAALAAAAEPTGLGTALLTLPTRAGAPLDSPELVRPEVAAAVRGAVTLAGWRVPVLRYAPDAALPLLRAVDTLAAVPGATLRHLAELAEFAVDLTARGRVLPGLAEAPPPPRPAAPVARAVWRPLLTGTDAAWARALALALPPAARAATGPDEPDEKRGPGAADVSGTPSGADAGRRRGGPRAGRHPPAPGSTDHARGSTDHAKS
ncbi:ATP-dependent helicase, partial [Micromonospora sp. CPCC 205546]